LTRLSLKSNINYTYITSESVPLSKSNSGCACGFHYSVLFFCVVFVSCSLWTDSCNCCRLSWWWL